MPRREPPVAGRREAVVADWTTDGPSSVVEEVIHLRLGPIEINRLRRIVQIGDRVVDLQPREYALLEHFLMNPGRVFTRAELQRDVFGYVATVRTNTVDVHISRLRQKLKVTWNPGLIRTIRGIGFVFGVDLASSLPATPMVAFPPSM